MNDVVLEARGLTKYYTSGHFRKKRIVRAVDGVDITLRQGEVVALVGESGSGKSTIARLLSQLIPRTAGDILLDGESITVGYGHAFRAYTKRVQMIFQDPFASLNPVHPVRHTLNRSVSIHSPKLSKKEHDAAVLTLLERVHLRPTERYVDKYPHELSGGQRQRASIARALGASPSVLLADEPISMLDVSIRLGVLNLLRELRDELRIAILYITHDIASARYFADRTMVMYAGRVVETGDSEIVTQHPAHPYTNLLIASAPDPDAEHPEGRAKGEPPSLAKTPTGCSFNPRCPFASELCRSEAPPLLELPLPVSVAPSPSVGSVTDAATPVPRQAACWLYDTTGRADAPSAPEFVADALGVAR
nr:ABC transporter ATP-binding protein [Leifsonia sp. Leaf325]